MYCRIAYLGERDGVVGADLVLLLSAGADGRLAAKDVEEAIHVLQ